MPDWSYRTIFRPLLFRLSAERARDFTLHAMGLISKLPGGSLLIRTLGHMESYPILESKMSAVHIKYPVGVSGALDIHGSAPRALAQFGLGFMEIGPVTLHPVSSNMSIRREVSNEALLYPTPYANDGVDVVEERLKDRRNYPLPLMIRTRHTSASTPVEALEEQQQLIERLSPYADALYLDVIDRGWTLEETVCYCEDAARMAHSINKDFPVFIYVTLDCPQQWLEQLAARADFHLLQGMVIGEAIHTADGDLIGKEGKALSLERVRLVREIAGDSLIIVAAGGVHEPLDALELMDAGANYVQLHSGLVYSGPGLPKRINEAIIYKRIESADHEPLPLRNGHFQHSIDAAALMKLPSFWQGWGWMWLLGLGMVIGGILAWIIAATSVVLPYDIRFLGIGRESMENLNERLLPFMSHDRVTLAGTMISIGILYAQLARYGLGKGLHWSKTALFISCLVGFSSFFLYLGYGYFDPLHGLVAILLLPMFILSMRTKANRPSLDPPNLVNDRSWRLAQWGQLMFVSLGSALAVGGITISFIGVTDVFVATDLAYLCTTPEFLAMYNERLVPLIAHDRAGFGGALFSNALVLLTIALWGINQGQRWLWWTLLAGGMPGFIAGFSVHAVIGYTDFWHLLPAYFACVLYVLGLIFLYPYLMSGRRITRKKDPFGRLQAP
ncbi:hypothetical protein [Paenibacillus eucommiae]|uniref:Dihydroorotate dehydrogenase n=1 Tax=Paenibacillus eucommiae TaxID=1355755 RepID=A0ABS4J7N7_9BACL|nr:hypothetical protein [Paenibacillus eucommiae]MBP1995855.1 dihydroorotate dehydrogenase [Paenibacillus eucommiae]